MKTTLTTKDLSSMEDEAFLEHLRQFPNGRDWEYAESFRYAATRLARMKGFGI